MRFSTQSVLASGLLVAAALAAESGCSGRPTRSECEKAVLRYWDGLDIAAYFSALSLRDAVATCVREAPRAVVRCAMQASMHEVLQCDGIDALPRDAGWTSGLYCFVDRGPQWSRCERSNRECEYYRHVARRSKREVSRCEPAQTASAIRNGDDHIYPAPSPAECERIRVDLVDRGHLGLESKCEMVSYRDLLRGPRKRTIAEPSAN